MVGSKAHHAGGPALLEIEPLGHQRLPRLRARLNLEDRGDRRGHVEGEVATHPQAHAGRAGHRKSMTPQGFRAVTTR